MAATLRFAVVMASGEQSAAKGLLRAPPPGLAQTRTPSPTPTDLRPPPPSPFESVGAVLAILLALAAGILGYRIIRGGRGL